MARLEWNTSGNKLYETGVDRGVLYLDGHPGIPWVGLVSVDVNPIGGSTKSYYLDGRKYLTSSSPEEFNATISAFTYPTEFGQCDGRANPRPGMYLTQQRRKSFGFSYRTRIGNDIDGVDHGYKIHLVYNGIVEPSAQSFSSINDQSNPVDFSWNLTTKPPVISGYKQTSHIIIDSRETAPLVLQSIENVLYGDDLNSARLPTIEELFVIYDELQVLEVFDNGDGTFTISGPDSAIQKLNDDTYQITYPSVVSVGDDEYLIGGSTTSVPTVYAGTDTSTDVTVPFVRAATELPNGSTITSRSWVIISGPMGAGTVIGTANELSWIPGSSPADTVDIRQPVCQEMAFELTSTAENSTTDWTTAYDYIEDISDDRGYTAGLVGFTSATGDMLLMIQQYAVEQPGNDLADYIPGLEECYEVGYGSGASSAAATNLGAPFIAAWIDAATNDPIFRKVQRDFRKSMYWDDALTQALADGVGPLGLAIHYDILVNHGVGSDSQSYGGIIAAARASSSKPPSDGGTEANYLTKLCDLRDAVLLEWGDYQTDGRSSMFRSLIAASKFSLLGTINWSVYGDAFSFNRPNPPVDARLGEYVLRYSATNYIGMSSSDITITGI